MSLGKYPAPTSSTPQIFMDIRGEGIWEKTANARLPNSSSTKRGDGEGMPIAQRNPSAPRLPLGSGQMGNPVTGNTPESGEVNPLQARRRRPWTGEGRGQGAGRGSLRRRVEQSHRLTEAMVLNLNSASEAYVPDHKDDTTKSALSRLSHQTDALLALLTAETLKRMEHLA
jgi:hypothetical protein